MRLDKYVSGAAGLSRGQARAHIRRGDVWVDGAAVTDASAHIRPGDSEVRLKGNPLLHQIHAHAMMYKPEGVITAASDARMETVMDLIPEESRRGMTPVGRLDRDVSGLLLLTSDGQLAHRIISPKWNVPKVYLARVDGRLEEEDIAAFQKGIALSDFTALPAALEIVSPNAPALGMLTVHEGKYHQVKRMFAALKKPVLSLKRIACAHLSLDETLSPGMWRPLTYDEADSLYRLTGLANPDKPS